MKASVSADLSVRISKQDAGNIGNALVYREGREELLAAAVFNVTNGATSARLSVRPVPESRFARAKYPLWVSAEDYRRKILSAVIEIDADLPASSVLLVFRLTFDEGLVRINSFVKFQPNWDIGPN